MKKLLLVEDDPFIRDITSIKLVEHGYTVIIAHDGESGLTQIDTEQPDLVLLDLDLPDMSGLDVLSHLKSTIDLKAIPVIIFSNNDDATTKDKALAIGIEGFFVKASTDYTELCKKIDSLFV